MGKFDIIEFFEETFMFDYTKWLEQLVKNVQDKGPIYFVGEETK